jgi:hypothetical protein
MAGKMMDERVEAFLADILALEGEDVNAVREGVRGALADYEQRLNSRTRRVHPSYSGQKAGVTGLCG